MKLANERFEQSLALLSKLLDAADFLDIEVRKLSLGQRMKCELIAGLLHMPRVLFLDEPTIGLDVVSQKMICDFFRKYNKETNATILLTSHYLEDIHSLCERIIFIDEGTIVFDGRLDDLIKRYAPDVHITVTSVDPMPEETLAELRSLGTLEEDAQDFKVRLRVERSRAADSAKEMLNRLPVSDIRVEEPSLREVVANMSSGERDVL